MRFGFIRDAHVVPIREADTFIECRLSHQ